MTQTSASAGRGVQLRNLTRVFGSVRALDDFSLDIAPGELVALLGPSGCGKTTALRALSGLEDVDSGSIVVDGEDVTAKPANRRDMAMVFQSYSLFPHMTVAGNIDFACELRKVAGDRRKIVAENLELVGLGTQADRYPHQLSGGQQQRVALARALAVRPKVLLLDEPLSALDAKVRVQLRDEIRRIQQEVGITTLFVTHDQEEALVVADRVGVMSSGKLMQIGAPADIYSRPVTGFVADFIGQTNKLPGRSAGSSASVLGQTVPLLPGSASGDVTVLIRPENITLRPAAGVAADRAGRVQITGFLGSHAKVRVEVPGGFVVAQLGVGESSGLAPGDEVEVILKDVPALAVATS
ncbi:ABC transporter ATP-binding protein [Propioniciclava tarda]|uniref:ABC-type quaternary amine transporter n=1 Tax=Propioniciclava tarda TaxID=433330 RepID=A0A4Q9KII9_PROTD|nr:ABC transporter ATP-binding protein [Propioniciclava tarda]TBT93111.1 ABC transporter ATP-binding protein [Propioniciclava tarda]SMO77816.1 putative spermidine/putrescine transport system ATP-binding protein [Propioniciclava tarda]